MEHKRKREEETRSTKRRRKKFNAGIEARIPRDGQAGSCTVLLADPQIKDAVLNAALLCESTKDAMFHGLAHQETIVVRKLV